MNSTLYAITTNDTRMREEHTEERVIKMVSSFGEEHRKSGPRIEGRSYLT
jgi:hypothetical protein